jgi:hypothetical protein
MATRFLFKRRFLRPPLRERPVPPDGDELLAPKSFNFYHPFTLLLRNIILKYLHNH